jgi:hypothetical protein
LKKRQVLSEQSTYITIKSRLFLGSFLLLNIIILPKAVMVCVQPDVIDAGLGEDLKLNYNFKVYKNKMLH